MSSLFRDNESHVVNNSKNHSFRAKASSFSPIVTLIVGLKYCRRSLASCRSFFLFTQLQSVCITSSQVSAIPDTHVLEKCDYNTYALTNATQHLILLRWTHHRFQDMSPKKAPQASQAMALYKKQYARPPQTLHF